jgi:hypothetical protein
MTSSGTRRSGHSPGSGGKSGSSRDTPFFPLVQSGLEGMGGELMGPVAEFEFGGPQELGVRLGNEEASHLQDFLLRLLENQRRQALGLGFLFGGKKDVGHEDLAAGKGVNFATPFSHLL